MGVFNIVEIIDVGIEKEKKRRDFYALVVENFEDQKMKKLFTHLRDWEEQHIRKFSQIREKQAGSEATDSYPGELQAYIGALVDNKLYADVSPKKFASVFTTPLSAIQRGIEFEKDAILLFIELLGFVTSNDRSAIIELINEEKQHIVYLDKMKRTLK